MVPPWEPCYKTLGSPYLEMKGFLLVKCELEPELNGLNGLKGLKGLLKVKGAKGAKRATV